MSRLVWLSESLQDLTRHFDFLKTKNLDVAHLAAQAIRDAAFSLVDFPLKGRLIEDGSDRRKLLVRFRKSAFVIHYFYDVEDDTVIIRVYHGREERPT